MIPLPGWMRGEIEEAWSEYVAQRVKDKKAMTHRSMSARVRRLQELKDAGHDPLQCLDEAINGHWLDFYVPRDKFIEAAQKFESSAEYLARAEAARIAAIPEPVTVDVRKMMAEVKAKIRRVA